MHTLPLRDAPENRGISEVVSSEELPTGRVPSFTHQASSSPTSFASDASFSGGTREALASKRMIGGLPCLSNFIGR